MKKDKIIYWVATGLLAAAMLMAGYMYLSKNEKMINNFNSIGIPIYMVTLLGLAKLLGAITLVIPFWHKLKEWVYAGFSFILVGAIWTHIATNTPWVAPLIFLAILMVSYLYHNKIKEQDS